MGAGDRVDDRQAEAGAALAPRAGSVGAGEALEDVRQRVGGDPVASVGDGDHDASTLAARRQLDRRVVRGVVDRVLEQRIEGRPQPRFVDTKRHVDHLAESPCPWRDLGPAHEDVLEERHELNLGSVNEVVALGPREQKQPLDDLFDPVQLVECDCQLRLRRRRDAGPGARGARARS